MDRDEPSALPVGMLHEDGKCPPNEALETVARSAARPSALPRISLPPADSAAPLPTASQVLEALLFSAAEPLSAARLAELAGIASAGEVAAAIGELNERYAAAGMSFRVETVARGFRLLTLPQFAPWIEKLNQQQALTRLSPAALETLAIVAYRQPVIRADIEAIRGVASGEVLNRLREIGLVRIVGRAEIVGRPLLYGTTRRFLDVFGLADLTELPPLEALPLTGKLPPKAGVEAAGPTALAAAGM